VIGGDGFKEEKEVVVMVMDDKEEHVAVDFLKKM